MVPTNEERYEVAAKLRNLANHKAADEELTLDALGLYRGENIEGYDTYGVMQLADLIEPEPINGETSDGYHTFNELYHHRALLFSVIVRNYPELCWKSKKHHTGDMYDGMFIVGINTPDGQASYHYDIEPYWDMFDCEELELAPEWDGHTSAQAIDRIGQLEPVRHGRWIQSKTVPAYHHCSLCKVARKMQVSCNKYVMLRYCPNCGARMDGKENAAD